MEQYKIQKEYKERKKIEEKLFNEFYAGQKKKIQKVMDKLSRDFKRKNTKE